MNKSHFWVVLSVIAVHQTPFSVIVALGITLVGWWKTRKAIWIIVILSVLVHPHVKAWLPAGPKGVISELNDNSALVTSGNTKILIPSMSTLWVGDRITITQTTPIEKSSALQDQRWMDYVNLNDLSETATEDAILSVQRFPIMQWVVDQWSRDPTFQPLVRKLLFQSDPLGEWGLIAGTGLIHVLIHRMLGSLLSGFCREKVNASIRLSGWIGLAIYLGYPLGLLRFVVSVLMGMLIRDRWVRWVSSVAVLWLLDPTLLTSMTVLIPLFFQAFGLFEREVAFRSVSFTLLQGLLWHRVSPLITLGYPVWRKGLMLCVLCVWAATLVSGFQPPVLHGVQFFESVMRVMSEFWVVRGKLSIPVVLALCAVWRISLWTPRLKALWGLAVIVYLPGLSAPWLTSITFIDVGQGNAIVLSSPLNRSVVVIDTGRSFARRAVLDYLDSEGVSRLDAIVLTHEDADHTDNVDALCAQYRIKQIVTTPEDIRLLDLVLVSLDASVRSPNDNQKSLVYGFQWGRTRFILTGDADLTNEAALISRYPNLRTDVLLVGHHGSASSTSSEWLGTLQPRLAIISVGDNSYGHPSSDVLKRLGDFHIPLLTTRQEGTIRFWMSPWGTIIITDSWKLKVLR